MKQSWRHLKRVIFALACCAVPAIAVADEGYTAPTAEPVVLQTWQTGPCSWTGRPDGDTLRDARGICGTFPAFASVATRTAAHDVAVKGPYGVMRAKTVAWNAHSLVATDGVVSTPQFTLRGLRLTFELVDGRIHILNPGRQGRVESEES